MKFRFAACLFITAVGVGACNLSPGYDLPSAGGEREGDGDGDIDIDLGGDGDDDLAPGVGCGGAGGAGGACADDSETAESN